MRRKTCVLDPLDTNNGMQEAAANYEEIVNLTVAGRQRWGNVRASNHAIAKTYCNTTANATDINTNAVGGINADAGDTANCRANTDVGYS